MRLGVDIMGGDYAPEQTVLGAIQALRELPSTVRLVLIGDRPSILSVLEREGVAADSFEIVHTTEVIGMADHPTKAIQQKPQSSIAIGFQLLKEGKLDSFASAGNTGAMLVGSMFSVKAIPGILRPAISTLLPKENGGWGLLLDVGVNADCKPEVLQQFAVLGSLYAKHVLNIADPTVGLMSIGEEEEKGNLLVKEAHQLIKDSKDIRFVGNVEGRDLFNERADVIVCDGFTGNVMLKEAESFFSILRRRGIRDPYIDRFDYEDYGGTPILGINSTVIIAHGISKAKAIKNMILLSRTVVEAKLSERIAHALSGSREAVS
ncbi:MAG: phosphate acyltransferase PlsX [Bacteroidia bacterium]|uniref:phosphate acyltransferase PlsX n=1 Tax=Candidatus Pollutiaquabacter sp. TaxID=3416354 RepID=UPI001B74DB33|nr:phosphate acyltransferase PlsX [Bacteroidota bacterium]MBP7268658.1 phosphate acyltransferase PlsX [Bacteroidia bacterium]MBP7436330.1 phosphate acyltransferase PlsX [Bacteroidia bacterium]MBP7728102.1 phosphate acyltransferase PlsX [Bacteroidia bacterium]MBP7771283.1 phosphate acyltransferase PlsX [Bacteroidia bacterium]